VEVSTVTVTADFFSIFGTAPLLGRALFAKDGTDNAAPVVVLSESLWRSRFGADPNIVGRAVALDHRSFIVAGVMPASFQTPFVGRKDQIWIPLVQDPLFSGWRTRPQQTHWLPALARLQPGVSIAEAQADLQTIGAGLARQLSGESGWQPGIQPLQQVIVGDVTTPLLMLLCAVSLAFF
jgi:putative ABC transport system permease protein